MQVVVIAVWWSVIAACAAPPQQGSGCRYSLVQAHPVAEVAGKSEAAARASVAVQPDSPLAIVRVDLSDVALTAGAGSFTRSGRHIVDVRNVSDTVITGARVWVMVGFDPRSGVGSGARLRRSLQPGEQARLEWRSGSGRGTDGAGRDVSVVALVHEVHIGGCTYRPASAWSIPSGL